MIPLGLVAQSSVWVDVVYMAAALLLLVTALGACVPLVPGTTALQPIRLVAGLPVEIAASGSVIALSGRPDRVPTRIRLVAANQGEVLAAEKLGKHKMLWQIITALYFMLRAASAEPLFAWAAPFFEITVFSPKWLGNFCIYFTTFLTLASGFSYFWKNRRIFADL